MGNRSFEKFLSILLKIFRYCCIFLGTMSSFCICLMMFASFAKQLQSLDVKIPLTSNKQSTSHLNSNSLDESIDITTHTDANPNSPCFSCKNWGKHINWKDSYLKLNDYIPLWGSYRPDIYFGMKTTKESPYQLVTGIFWNNGINKYSSDFRHSTKQDELTNFYWTRNNGRTYGIEDLIDEKYDMHIKASFIVPLTPESPSWIQRIEVNRISESNNEKSVFFYFGIEASERNQIQDYLKESQLSFTSVFIHTKEDNVIYSFGGKSSISNSFILQIRLPLDANSNETCQYPSSESCLISSNLTSLSYFGDHGNKDSLAAMEDIQNEIKYTRSSNLIQENGQFNNQLHNETTCLFLNLKSSLFSFSMDVILFDNLNYDINSKLDFDEKAIELSSWNDMNTLLSQEEHNFQETFDKIFHNNSTINTNEFDGINIRDYSQLALSNVLGGIGYFYGIPVLGDAIPISESGKKLSSSNSLTTSIQDHEVISLFTATPSRTSFPRGFLWDEGFHQLVISQFDPILSLTIINSWMNSMYIFTNEDNSKDDEICSTGGWIPREMILGDIARSKVPNEFVIQRVDIANPPTLFLVLEKLLHQHQQRPFIFEFQLILQQLYPKLQKWLRWFEDSQKGNVNGLYRWRGRSIDDKKVLPNTLASGLDDFPRSPYPSFDESHVDLTAWMLKANQIMLEISTFLNLSEQMQFYESQSQLIQQKLLDVHFTKAKTNPISLFGGFYDIGYYHEHIRYEPFVLVRCGHANANTNANEVNQNSDRRVVDVEVPIYYIANKIPFCPSNYPDALMMQRLSDGKPNIYSKFIKPPLENTTIQHIPVIGYNNLFPFILRLIKVGEDANIMDQKHMASALHMIRNPDLLWTDYGLRSIAKNDTFYRKMNAEGDEPYWRGPIWINVNYLTLGALQFYGNISGFHQQECQELYLKLRFNLLKTILTSVNETGFFWEQYDDMNGLGIRGHPFTGWTTLVVNIIAEIY